MHLVIDLNDHGLPVSEIGHLYPGMHWKGIAGCRETILAKDLIRKGLSALELIGIISRNTELYADRLFMLPKYGSR